MLEGNDTAHQELQEPQSGDVEVDDTELRQAEKLNRQFEELRQQARATLAAVKGAARIRNEADWQAMRVQARQDYESGAFIIEQLGARRMLEPRLMATLLDLRTRLLSDLEGPTTADEIVVDNIILAYRNLLRLQGWFENMALVVERELFGQAPLSELHAPMAADTLERKLRRAEERLLPLMDRTQRKILRGIAQLSQRANNTSTNRIFVNRAEQVNVCSAVQNNGC